MSTEQEAPVPALTLTSTKSEEIATLGHFCCHHCVNKRVFKNLSLPLLFSAQPLHLSFPGFLKQPPVPHAPQFQLLTNAESTEQSHLPSTCLIILKIIRRVWLVFTPTSQHDINISYEKDYWCPLTQLFWFHICHSHDLTWATGVESEHRLPGP